MFEMVWGDPKKGDPMKAKIPAGRILIDGGFTAQ
jgi:hypothetical protein